MTCLARATLIIENMTSYEKSSYESYEYGDESVSVVPVKEANQIPKGQPAEEASEYGEEYESEQDNASELNVQELNSRQPSAKATPQRDPHRQPSEDQLGSNFQDSGDVQFGNTRKVLGSGRTQASAQPQPGRNKLAAKLNGSTATGATRQSRKPQAPRGLAQKEAWTDNDASAEQPAKPLPAENQLDETEEVSYYSEEGGEESEYYDTEAEKSKSKSVLKKPKQKSILKDDKPKPAKQAEPKPVHL